MIVNGMSERPAYHKAPFANREKWFGTEMMNSARSVNMSLSCNVSPTPPALLSLCWYSISGDLDNCLSFQSSCWHACDTVVMVHQVYQGSVLQLLCLRVPLKHKRSITKPLYILFTFCILHITFWQNEYSENRLSAHCLALLIYLLWHSDVCIIQ